MKHVTIAYYGRYALLYNDIIWAYFWGFTCKTVNIQSHVNQNNILRDKVKQELKNQKLIWMYKNQSSAMLILSQM